MLVSLLLSCLFFGLISMIFPSGRKTEWIYVLLIFVLIVSVGFQIKRTDISLPEIEDFQVETSGVFPEASLLEVIVSNRVYSLTGLDPVSVESDLERLGDSYKLTWIRVVIPYGNEQEVQDALQKDFSFQGFTVLREPEGGSGDGFHIST